MMFLSVSVLRSVGIQSASPVAIGRCWVLIQKCELLRYVCGPSVVLPVCSFKQPAPKFQYIASENAASPIPSSINIHPSSKLFQYLGVL